MASFYRSFVPEKIVGDFIPERVAYDRVEHSVCDEFLLLFLPENEHVLQD